MPESPPPLVVRLDRDSPYLAIQHVTVFVRDQEASAAFYRDTLGFPVVFDVQQAELRWMAVAPPDGTTVLALVAPAPGSAEEGFIGRQTAIAFMTEDVTAKFEEWSRRGVRFHHAPETPKWGGIFSTFEDLDGNTFGLFGFDAVTREIESKRVLMARTLEGQRRAEHELEIARQVQARLFPQMAPSLTTLDYAGLCHQARTVGGDYYDFLDLGHGRLGLVVGDIAGKGMGAALLMANLQANLRGQCAVAADEPQRMLGSLNRLFYANTPENAYATLFFADYDDRTRRLRYANCGHLCGLVLKADGRLERLEATGTVLGLFEQSEYAIDERQLGPGDLLALYTDGITERTDESGEELGELRLAEMLRRYWERTPREVLSGVLDGLAQFSTQEAHDDVTLIVAKCR
jgi:serine phosphatase RsbU (regulator of sigma subunit)/predicted enzyme related to lactoylglutathione lyase